MQAALGLLVGLCMGSLIAHLASCWPDRLGELARGRSRCDSCRMTLGPLDLVPVASWLWLRGRCRRCKAVIPAIHPLVEALAGAQGLVALALLDAPAGWLVAAAGWTLLAMALIDLEHLRLPDMLTLPLLAAGIIAALVGAHIDAWRGPGMVESFAGAALGLAGLWAVAALYRRLRGREGLGLGDVKLLAAAGAWCGAPALAWVLLLGALLGLLYGLARGLSLRSTEPVPFGPALAAAFWLVMLARWSGA